MHTYFVFSASISHLSLLFKETTFNIQWVRRLNFVLLAFLFICNGIMAQAPPDADIYLFDLKLNGKSISISKPVNITHRKGYDNQPSFTPQGNTLLYTSIREDGQADTYLYDLQKKTTRQVTRTPESEYSPTVMPDGSHFSVIRVEKDQSQRLWQFPISGTDEPALILENIKPVGYHCWLNADSLALFVLGEPNSFLMARISTGDTVLLERSIGRAIYKIPKKNVLSFVHKSAPAHWEIIQLDLQTGTMTSIVKTLEGSEDFVWTPDGRLLMCRNATLYQYRPGTDTTWIQVADLSKYGINQLSRLAINAAGTKLALVSQ
jgi:hypothetical protein